LPGLSFFTPLEFMVNRRKFLRQAALAGTMSGMVPVWASATDAHKPINPEKKRALRVAHITDVHITASRVAETCFARVLRDINNLEDRPDLIINTGDTVMDENKQTREVVAARWHVWNTIVQAENKIPMKSALGNHDVWYGPDAVLDAQYKTDKRYGKAWAMEMLGLPARYYSFDKNGWRFIALDSINGTGGYQLDDQQFAWLEAELMKSKSPVLIFNHVPILSMGALLYLTKRTPIQDVKFPSGDMHQDHQRIKDLLAKHPQVKLALSGHVHYVDAVEYLGVKYLCNGAVSGNWWGNPLTLDDFAPAYAMLDLYDDGTSDYRIIFYDVSA
jgi:3',5'-cyclic-AMP phosphodiesterase